MDFPGAGWGRGGDPPSSWCPEPRACRSMAPRGLLLPGPASVVPAAPEPQDRWGDQGSKRRWRCSGTRAGRTRLCSHKASAAGPGVPAVLLRGAQQVVPWLRGMTPASGITAGRLLPGSRPGGAGGVITFSHAVPCFKLRELLKHLPAHLCASEVQQLQFQTFTATAGVPSLIGEPRSHKPPSAAKTTK